jgi:hypothetical protein
MRDDEIQSSEGGIGCRNEAVKLAERAIDLLRSGAKTETPATAARAKSDVIVKKLFGDRRPPVIKFVLPVWQQDA